MKINKKWIINAAILVVPMGLTIAGLYYGTKFIIKKVKEKKEKNLEIKK